jgi:hypothetical protein
LRTAEHRFTFASVAHGGQALNGQQQNDIGDSSHQTDAMKCTGLPVENAGKWHICHPDARWPVIDVIGNLNLWCAFDSNGDF